MPPLFRRGQQQSSTQCVHTGGKRLDPHASRPQGLGMRRLLLIGVLLAIPQGCTARRVPAPIKGEPVCADFELGAARTKFKGALKWPVMVTVLDGSTTVSERLVLGKRKASDEGGKLVVEDDDETHRWNRFGWREFRAGTDGSSGG